MQRRCGHIRDGGSDPDGATMTVLRVFYLAFIPRYRAVKFPVQSTLYVSEISAQMPRVAAVGT